MNWETTVFAHPCNVNSLQKFGVDATDNLK